jgi:hypothetical protein
MTDGRNETWLALDYQSKGRVKMNWVSKATLILCMSFFLFLSNHASAVDVQPTQNSPSPAQNTTQPVQAAPQPAQETKPYTEEYTPPKLLSADEYCRKVQTNPTIKRYVNTSMLYLEKNHQTLSSHFNDERINKAVRDYLKTSPNESDMKEVVAQCMFKLIKTDYVLFFVGTITSGDLESIRSYAPDKYENMKKDWVSDVTEKDTGQLANLLKYALFSPGAEAILNDVLNQRLNSFNDFLKKNPEANPHGFTMESEQQAAQSYRLDDTKLKIVSVIGIVFLLSNFIAYNLLPKFRNFLIATPFDIGAKGEKSDAEHAVKNSRYFAELALLALICSAYVMAFFYGAFYVGQGIVATIKTALIICLSCYGFYIVARYIYGYTTRCPKCSTMFARGLVNSSTEPNGTYEKRNKQGNGYLVTIIERGIIRSDWSCAVCVHEWQTTRTYEKSISEYSI